MNDTQYDHANQVSAPSQESNPVSEADTKVYVPTDATADHSEECQSVDTILSTVVKDPAISADPDQDPDPDRNTSDTETSTGGLDELRGELNALRAELTAERAKHTRIEREYAEFHALYPDVSITSCPDSVWAAVNDGTPLAAAYALEERRHELIAQKAKVSNEQNRACSFGRIDHAQNEFFTPDEVRAMSQSEVRSNLSKIMLSMKKWH